MDKQEALRIVEMCLLSYDTPPLSIDTAEHFTNVMPISISGAAAISLVHNEGLYIIFRGTDELRDALLVTEADPVLFHPTNPYFGKVHLGFLEYYNRLKAFVGQAVHTYLEMDIAPTQRRIVFSGHSLGGCAVLAAIDTSIDIPDQAHITCVTFGSPKIGDPDFAKAFNKLVPNAFRFVNSYDTVSLLPITFLQSHYTHVGKPIYLHGNGRVTTTTSVLTWLWFTKHYIQAIFTIGLWNGLKKIKDHSLFIYKDNIANANTQVF